MEAYLWHDWWLARHAQVGLRVKDEDTHTHTRWKLRTPWEYCAYLGVVRFFFFFFFFQTKAKKPPLAPGSEIFHSFAQTLLEIAFIIETMIESSKSGKSIGCSVAINNRLETSRHWWNPRPFLCGGLSAVAVHVNNAWSQIDSCSLSSPSTHRLRGSRAGAPRFPGSDWLCLEGSGGDGKSPAPFSHAVLAASAPRCSDLCVCR